MSAAIYARISSDQDGTALGVQRQVEDCQALADSLGWPVGDVYVDNDVSAWSGKRRPEYERMLTDLGDRTRDAVLVYHLDRLVRRPLELEQFLPVLTAANVRQVRFVSSAGLDVGTGDGLMVLRMMAAMAANESDTKSRRVKRKMVQNAEAGLPHGSGRSFGYEPGGLVVRESEAQVIRDLTERYLAGESLRSLAGWLTEQQVPTVRGGEGWKSPTLRAMFASGRIAGVREHNGQVIGKAVWEPIITEQTRNKVLARMSEQATSGRRSPRSYLLTGLLKCHRCQHTLYSARRVDNRGPRPVETRRYVCTSGPDHGGCGGTMIVADQVEQWITAAVLFRLDSPELADALAGRAAADERTQALADTLGEDTEQLRELADLYAAKQITAAEWMTARNPIQARIKRSESALARATRTDALSGLVGHADTLTTQWETLPLSRQVAIVRAVLDHVTVGPGTAGARRFDPNRLSPTWRL